MLVLLACTISVVAGASVGGYDPKPWFCHDLDCPRYSVESNSTGFEVRNYESTMWVATNITTANYAQENYNLFQKLFKYISGNNAANSKIPMTAPVLRKVVPGGSGHNSFFTMHFMVPHDRQHNAPAPVDPSVYLTTIPPLKVYVKSFGGYASIHDDEVETRELTHELGNPSLFDHSYYYTAGYDSPFNIRDRHNEVWVVAV